MIRKEGCVVIIVVLVFFGYALDGWFILGYVACVCELFSFGFSYEF